MLGGTVDNNSTQRSQQNMEMSLRSTEKEHMNDIQRELKLQDIQIGELQRQIQELEDQNEMIRNTRVRMGKLPPIEAQQQ
jgi:peptidoglycan hydrolase CwlO-like protein